MKLTRKKIVLAAAAFFVLAIALVTVQAVWRPFGGHGGAPVGLRSHRAGFDIRHPDAIIDSAALSRLPADMIRTPFLRALFTRDFVDYYEADTTRLSAEGALRRLAFERDQDWLDEVVKRVFDEPARVLLWRAPGGRLGYWAMVVRRNGLAKLAQAVANVAANDSQLSKIAAFPGDVPIYALKLAVGRTLLFAAKGDQLLIMSEPGILLDAQNQLLGDRAPALARMLDDGGEEAIKAYQLDGAGQASEHRLVVSANYISFGYQTFFPGIDALRFDFGAPGGGTQNSPENGQATAAKVADAGGGAPSPASAVKAAGGEGAWSTSALIDPAHLPQHWNNADVWRALPANAAACVSLPVSWDEAAGLLGKLGQAQQGAAQVLRERMTGPVGVCWYAKSNLATPVFVARLTEKAAGDPAQLAVIKSSLASAFGDAIGAYEAKAGNVPGGVNSSAQAGSSGQAGPRRLPVETRALPGDVTLWTRPVSARSGTAQSAVSPYASQLAAPRYFPVTLALAHGYVVFSPDGRLVDDALAVLDKRYPAVADTLAPKRLDAAVMVITPSSGAALIEREAGRALPEDQEAILRNAARTRLLPKLREAALYPPFTLSLPAKLPSSAAWVPVEWNFEMPVGVGPAGDDAAARPLGPASPKDDANVTGGPDDPGDSAPADFDEPDVDSGTSGN